MKEDNYSPQTNQQNSSQPLPELDIIDLDAENGIEKEEASQSRESEQQNSEDYNAVFSEEPDLSDDPKDNQKRTGFRINIHIVFALVAVACVVVIIIKFSNWGVFIDQDELFQDGEGTYVDTWDNIVPLLNDEGEVVPLKKSDGLKIALFGNNPFSDDRKSVDGFASILEEMSGGSVYNFSLGKSYLTSEQAYPDPTIQPWDSFTFYWMSLMTTDIEVADFYGQSLEALGSNAPEEALEVRDMLTGIDFGEIDVIVVMYDATDYLMGHNLNSTDGYETIQQFTGNLGAGLDVLLQHHPHIRVIVMSPTYAFSDQLDEKGEYISSDIQIYNEQPLSMYAIAECMTCSEKGVTFVDNIYGTFNEEEAKDYLIDNLHMNVEGRKKVAARLVEAMNYFGSN